MAPKDILTREFLIKEFVENKKSVHQIAKENGIKSSTSVSQFIKKFDLSREPINSYEHILTKDFLVEEYIIKNKSAHTIGEELGYSKRPVLDALRKYKLTRKFTFSDKWQKWPEKIRKHKFIPGKYFDQIKRGAFRREIEFNITIDYIGNLFEKQFSKCVYSGLELRFYKNNEKARMQTASLDRIDSKKGYIVDNVQWIHKKIQYMKWDMSEEEFLSFIKIIAENRKLT
jgi:hypothetical protein